MTHDEIAELERLYAASTQGEWKRDTELCVYSDDERTLFSFRSGYTSIEEDICNVDFIASAHNAFPALLAAAKRAIELEEHLAQRIEMQETRTRK